MAISGFGRGKGDSTGTSMPSSSASSSSGGGTGNLTAFIDQGSEFEGKLSFKDTVRIDGKFSGEITSDNTLIVGESGQIQATIHSVCVVISGLVEGDVHATEQIILHKTAVVNGDLESPAIMMEEGAQLNGSVKMGRGASSSGNATKSSSSNSGSRPASAAGGDTAAGESEGSGSTG